MSLQTRLALTVMATLSVPLTVAAILLALVLPAQLTRHTDREVLSARDAVHAVLVEQCDSLQSVGAGPRRAGDVPGLTDATVRTVPLGNPSGASGQVGVRCPAGADRSGQSDHSRPPTG